MIIETAQLNKLGNLFNAYIFARFREGVFDFDFDGPYENLRNEFIKIPEIQEYFDDDVFNWMLEREITNE